MDFDALFSFIIASVVLTLSPGPDIIYVLMQSITNGRRYGIATAVGLVLGIIVHTSLVAFGISTIIQNASSVFLAIKVMGSLYMLFLAYKVWVSPAAIQLNHEAVPKKNISQLIRQGFLMNVLNPKVTLFFLSFLPGFLFSDTMNTVVQFYVLGGLFMFQAFIIFFVVSYIAGTVFNVLKNNIRLSYVLKYLQIVVFVGIAIFILI